MALQVGTPQYEKYRQEQVKKLSEQNLPKVSGIINIGAPSGTTNVNAGRVIEEFNVSPTGTETKTAEIITSGEKQVAKIEYQNNKPVNYVYSAGGQSYTVNAPNSGVTSLSPQEVYLSQSNQTNIPPSMVYVPPSTSQVSNPNPNLPSIDELNKRVTAWKDRGSPVYQGMPIETKKNWLDRIIENRRAKANIKEEQAVQALKEKE